MQLLVFGTFSPIAIKAIVMLVLCIVLAVLSCTLMGGGGKKASVPIICLNPSIANTSMYTVTQHDSTL